MLAPCPFKCVLGEVRLQVTQSRKQWNLSFLPIRISIKGFVNIYEGSKFQTRLGAMKHGHGTRGVALAFDAATRRGRRCLRIRPRRATWIPRDFRRLAPTRLRLELIHSESGRYGRNGRFRPKFKKKKRCRTHRLT